MSLNLFNFDVIRDARNKKKKDILWLTLITTVATPKCLDMSLSWPISFTMLSLKKICLRSVLMLVMIVEICVVDEEMCYCMEANGEIWVWWNWIESMIIWCSYGMWKYDKWGNDENQMKASLPSFIFAYQILWILRWEQPQGRDSGNKKRICGRDSGKRKRKGSGLRQLNDDMVGTPTRKGLEFQQMYGVANLISKHEEEEKLASHD